MRRIALLAGIAGLACIPSAEGFIHRTVSLKDVLAGDTNIFVARVERLDLNKASMVLTVSEDLKGQFTKRRLSVDLHGDGEAQKGKQSAQLLERLAPNLELVVFDLPSARSAGLTMFAYSNGTWFQLGRTGPADSTSYSFAHFEPYLRRTFKGTTAELKQVVADALSGKKAPPPPDPKEPPGIGPPVKK